MSNELLYEIFGYLDGYDIHRAFFNLNIRFRRLITCSLLPLKINLCAKSQTSVEYLCRNVIIPNKHRIRSIHLKNELLIDTFLANCIISSSFYHLESIVFNEISNDTLRIPLLRLRTLPHLFSLTIYLKKDSSYDLNQIYQVIFHLPILKYNKLSLVNANTSNIIVPPIVSGIEYLIIDHHCSLDQLITILQYTPQLRRLQCKYLKHSHNNRESKDKLILSHLSYISITNCCLRFDDFETFITQISSQLEVLRITTYWDMTYLHADRWEQLILQHMPHLYRFDFNHHQRHDNNYEYIDFSVLISRFISQFWVERQWLVELTIIRSVLICTIRPHRTSMDHQKYPTIKTIVNQNSNENSIQTVPIQLTIADFCSASWYQSIIDQINPIFSVIRFTRMHINCNEMFTGTLIKLVQLLPNLDSLKLSSFPFLQLSCLSAENTQKLLLVSTANKITKMSFEGMHDFEQVYFVLFLCLRIQYLEVRCTKYTNLDILLRFILMKNCNFIPYLSSLCLYVPNADDKLVYKLQKFTDFEKLLNEYTIKRFGDNIQLHWKK